MSGGFDDWRSSRLGGSLADLPCSVSATMGPIAAGSFAKRVREVRGVSGLASLELEEGFA